MRIRVTFLTLLLAFVGADLMFAQAQFDTSLHKSRAGKVHRLRQRKRWYGVDHGHSNAGFVLLEMPLGHGKGCRR